MGGGGVCRELRFGAPDIYRENATGVTTYRRLATTRQLEANRDSLRQALGVEHKAIENRFRYLQVAKSTGGQNLPS